MITYYNVFSYVLGGIKTQRGTGASSATQELDDLMTNLDALKIPQAPQEEPVS